MTYVDTNILVYLLEGGSPFTVSVAKELQRLADEQRAIVTSVLTFTEFMTGHEASATDTLKSVPRLDFMPLDEHIALRAAALQRDHRISIGDAIHLATCAELGCTQFFTNDARLAKVATEYCKVLKPAAA